MEKPSFRWIVIAVLLVGFAVWRDCHYLFQSSVATGIDGYYYVLQVDTLRNAGHLYFPTNTPLVLYLLTALSYLTQDTILTIKIGAVLMHILLALGVMALIAEITRNAWFGLTGLLIATLAGLHFFFISEFLSNLGALAFVLWGAWATVRFAKRKKPVWLTLSILLLFSAVLSHRSTIGLITLNAFTISAAYILTTSRLRRRTKLLTLAIVLILLMLPLACAWQPLVALPKQLMDELLKIPRLPLRQIDLAENWMLVTVVVITTFVWLRYRHVLLNNGAGLSLVAMVLWGCLLTLNPFLNHHTGVVGIVGRLGIMTYLQVAIAVPILLSVLFEVSRRMSLLTALFFLPFLASSYFAALPLSLRKEYLQDREILVRELPKLRTQLCERPFIVARHGDEFLVTAVLSIPSQQKPPLEQQQCIYWLIYRPPTVPVLAEESIATVNYEFVLVENSSLRKAIESLNLQERRRLAAVNSHLRDMQNIGTH